MSGKLHIIAQHNHNCAFKLMFRFLLQGFVVVTLAAPERLTFNVTLNKPFAATDQLQSILISKPAFINSTAATLSTLFDSNSSNTQMVRR